MSNQLQTQATLAQAESPQHPLDRNLQVPQPVRLLWRRERTLVPTGNKSQFLSCPAHSPTLYRMNNGVWKELDTPHESYHERKSKLTCTVLRNV
jgi:hypothetical protein